MKNDIENKHEQSVEQPTVFDGFISGARSTVAQELRELALDGKSIDEVIAYYEAYSLPDDTAERQVELTNRLFDAFDAQTKAIRLGARNDPRAGDVKDAADIMSKVAEVTGGIDERIKQEHDLLLFAVRDNLKSNIKRDTEGAFVEDSHVLAEHAQAVFGTIPAALDYRAAAMNPARGRAIDRKRTSERSHTRKLEPMTRIALATMMAVGIAGGGAAVVNAAPNVPKPEPKQRTYETPTPEVANPLDPTQPANITVLKTPESKPTVDPTPTPSTPDNKLNNAITDVTPIEGAAPQTLSTSVTISETTPPATSTSTPETPQATAPVVNEQQPDLGFTPVTVDVSPTTVPTALIDKPSTPTSTEISQPPDSAPTIVTATPAPTDTAPTNNSEALPSVTPTAPSTSEQPTNDSDPSATLSALPINQINEAIPSESPTQPSNSIVLTSPNTPTSPETSTTSRNTPIITPVVDQPSVIAPESPLPGIAIVDIPVAPPAQDTPSEGVAPETVDPSGGDTNGLGFVPAPIDVVPVPPAEVTPTAPETADPFTPPIDATPTPATPKPANPAPKTPDKPAPTPAPEKPTTVQEQYIQAAQNLEKRGGEWTNRGIALAYLINHGYTPAQATGIVANLMSESGLNPSQHQIGGPAEGLAQWEAGRLDAMKAYVTGQGKAWDDLEGQLSFLIHELDTTEGGAKAAILATSNRTDATLAFMNNFERPNPIYAHADRRVANANTIADGYNAELQKVRPAPETPAPVDTTPEKVGKVVYTNQLDPAFSDMKYEDGALVGMTACGAASLDMVANTIGDKPGHGAVMRTMFADKTLPEGGTSQPLIMKEAPQFGLRTEYITDYSITEMKKVLDAGGLITFSGRTGTKLLPFPGHFVVVYNVNVADGTMQVADPGFPANNGKWFSLQAELDASAADRAAMQPDHTGLHNGFIAYYPARVATGSVDDVLPTAAPTDKQVAPSSDQSTLDQSAAVTPLDIVPTDTTEKQVFTTDVNGEATDNNNNEKQPTSDGWLKVNHDTATSDTTEDNIVTGSDSSATTSQEDQDKLDLAAKKLAASKKFAELKKAALDQQAANEAASTQEVAVGVGSQ